jgi:lipopolysaccharide/colanic/teichoic acid biosynthesis glycosyltransferase
LWKFIQLVLTDADKKGLQITVGGRDPRITSTGYYIRKYKLDELPQLMNVVLGQMSLVGPRPEVNRYVSLYNAEQRRVLSVKPGITDWASIRFRNENEILEGVEHPEKTYINEIMPKKLRLNLEYVDNRSVIMDFKIILTTLKSVFL